MSATSPGIMRNLRKDASFQAQVRLLEEHSLRWELCEARGKGHPYLLVAGEFRWPVASSPVRRCNLERVKGSLRRWLREHRLIQSAKGEKLP
jgi:hypothetical protein